MPATATLTSVQITPAGVLRANFGDGTQLEYSDRTALADDAAPAADVEWCRRFLLARWVALNPALDNPNYINGTTIEVDPSSALNPVAVGVV